MFKIFDNSFELNPIFKTISNGFLEYIPAGLFTEVTDIQDADVVMITGELKDDDFIVRIGSPASTHTLKDIEADIAEKRALIDAHKIVWLDVLGPNAPKENLLNTENTGLKETDIIACQTPLPEQPNAFTNVCHLERSVYRPRGRYTREKGSVAILADNFEPSGFQHSTMGINIIEIIKNIIDLVSHIYIGSADTVSPEWQDALGDAYAKLVPFNFYQKHEVAQHLSKMEFVLTTREDVGIEMMGIEGGLSGCQPIYPGTEFYKNALEGTGVAFYDTDNRADSLRTLIEKGSQFDEKTLNAFRKQFSAEETLPAFWQKVYDFYKEQ